MPREQEAALEAQEVQHGRRVPRGRYLKGEQRRTQIIRSTADLIAERGINAVTHRAVAARAGVGGSAPSYFFPSIDDLIVEAFRTVIGRMIRDLGDLTRSVQDERLSGEEAVAAYVAFVSSGSLATDRVQYEAYLFASGRPTLHAAVEESTRAMDEVARAMLVAAGRADLLWAAPVLRAISDGFALQRLASGPDGALDGLRDGLLAVMSSSATRTEGRAPTDARPAG